MRTARAGSRLFRVAGGLVLVAVAAHAQFALSPAPPPGPPVPLPNGIATVAYTTTISAVNNVGAVSWNNPAGLPPGLTLNPIVGGPAAANIAGTPTTPGTFTFTVQATDLITTLVASQQYRITIAPALAITTPATLTGATTAFNYTYTFSAANGTPPYVWSAGVVGRAGRKNSLRSIVLPPGTLPAGLNLSGTGVLSGIATQTGTFIFDIKVADSSSQVTSAPFTLTVNPTPTVSSPTILTAGTTGVAYGVLLTVQGGTPPFDWLFVGGALPAGLVLGSGGALSGTPTQAGTYNFTALVRDAWGASNAASFTLLITQGLTITTPSPLPNGAVGSFYQEPLGVTGVAPYTWALVGGALPGAITLNPLTGLLSGTPGAAGIFQFTIQVTDSRKAITQSNFTLTIAPQLAITTASLPSGTVGTIYSQSVVVTGGTKPYAWSVTGALPAGLALNSTTGAIAGTPTTAGTSGFTVTVTDAAKITASQSYRVNIASASPPLSFTTPSPLAGATGGSLYSQPIGVTGGTPPYAFAITGGALPGGLTLNGATGALSGTPSSIGTFQFTVTVTDTNLTGASQSYQLTVTAVTLPAPTISGVSSTEPPAQQPALSLQLAQAYPLPLTGTITLTFASAQGNVDDPSIQFLPKGRTATFTVAAGSTNAVFPTSPLLVSTGTVAGTITLTLSFQAGGQDVTPSPAPTQTITIAAAAPVITAVTAQRTSSGIEVDVTGYSTTRTMTSATFQFQAAPGTNLQTSQVMVTVDQLFATWYNGSGSAKYGSQFTFAQQFTISGNNAGITGVAVTLTNAQGTSNSMSANLP